VERVVEPEWLDELPPADPRASRSRRDLVRVNRWMGHAGILARCLRQACGPHRPRTIVELGAGDGQFLLCVARRLAPRWQNVSVILVDRQRIVSPETCAAFARLGWVAQTEVTDVFDWMTKAGPRSADCIITNLFLHHLPGDSLGRLFEAVAERTHVFVACEPRRAPVSFAASRLLWLIGGNAITRHDAAISVRAGFARQELSGLWPRGGNWRLVERAAGLFSHCFIAHRAPLPWASRGGGR